MLFETGIHRPHVDYHRKRPVMKGFDVLFDVEKLFKKHSFG